MLTDTKWCSVKTKNDKKRSKKQKVRGGSAPPDAKKQQKKEKKMRRRRKMNKYKSKKLFRKTSRPVNMNRRKGNKGLKRGGYRL